MDVTFRVSPGCPPDINVEVILFRGSLESRSNLFVTCRVKFEELFVVGYAAIAAGFTLERTLASVVVWRIGDFFGAVRVDDRDVFETLRR